MEGDKVADGFDFDQLDREDRKISGEGCRILAFVALGFIGMRPTAEGKGGGGENKMPPRYIGTSLTLRFFLFCVFLLGGEVTKDRSRARCFSPSESK